MTIVCHLALQFGFEFLWNFQHLHKQSAANSLSRQRMFAKYLGAAEQEGIFIALRMSLHAEPKTGKFAARGIVSGWMRSSLNIFRSKSGIILGPPEHATNHAGKQYLNGRGGNFKMFFDFS